VWSGRWVSEGIYTTLSCLSDGCVREIPRRRLNEYCILDYEDARKGDRNHRLVQILLDRGLVVKVLAAQGGNWFAYKISRRGLVFLARLDRELLIEQSFENGLSTTDIP
jgi:hypothetical protein